MKRVLVTGATGFIGRQCVRLLAEKGYDVHVVSSKPRDGDGGGIHWHRADLLEPDKAWDLTADVRPTHLLHFAWYAVPGKFWASIENLRWVQASLGLIQGFVAHGGERVVMAGTCAEYGWDYGYFSEQVTPCIPSTLYGACKHALQTMVNALSRQTGLSAAWGRLFLLYGPHEHPDRLVAFVIRSLLQSEPARCSHGNQIRDFLHVEDVASAFVALMESPVQGAVNIASGCPVRLKDLIGAIGEKIGRRDLIRFGERAESPNDPPLLLADVRTLRNTVGWTPKYSLDAGLDQTIQWWKDHSGVTLATM